MDETAIAFVGSESRVLDAVDILIVTFCADWMHVAVSHVSDAT